MTRIGILASGFLEWAGGVDFLYSVVDSIRAADEPADMHLLVVEPSARTRVGRLWQVACARWASPHMIRGEPKPPDGCEDLARLCGSVHRVRRGRCFLNAVIEGLGLEVLIPSLEVLPRGLRCPWIGYLYDFQHRQLPGLFGKTERRARDRHFASMMARADAVVVNSRDTANEGRRAYPAHAAKLHSLPFNASPRDPWFDDPVRPPHSVVSGTRGLPFFMVSNQFWMHKDHATAFRAFARVAALHPGVRLVCTGETSDYRRPSHFADMRRLLDDLGVADRVSITGLLPKSEQIALLRTCVALLQPTRSEGGPGGGAVYDAVALGVRSIVSDIPVNRELSTEPTVTLFPVGDADALAARMADALRRPATPPEAADLRALGLSRRAACGRVLLDLVAEVRAAPRPLPREHESASG
jgi:glycosyltransferase involved in cell wall biosynthesis